MSCSIHTGFFNLMAEKKATAQQQAQSSKRSKAQKAAAICSCSISYLSCSDQKMDTVEIQAKEEPPISVAGKSVEM